MTDKSSVLNLAFQMGSILLENGAEITRVQETMEMVASSNGDVKFNVYVLTNAIFANGVENGVTHRTEIKTVKDPAIHVGRISAVNQLSRELVAGEVTTEEAFDRLEKIRRLPFARPPVSLLCCGLGCGCFAVLKGGVFPDVLAAFVCGVAMEGFLLLAQRVISSKFLLNLLASFFAGSLAISLFLLGLGQNLDVVTSCAIIRLVPGVALTTSIRDFFNSDYLSGTIRMMDAIIVGACIAVGVGVASKLFSMIMGGAIL